MEGYGVIEGKGNLRKRKRQGLVLLGIGRQIEVQVEVDGHDVGQTLR